MKKLIPSIILVSLLSTTAHAATSSPASHKFGIGVRVNNNLYFPTVNVTNSGSTTTDSARYSSSKAPTLFEYQFFYARPHGWGFNLGVDYMSVAWDKAASNTVTVSGLDLKSTIITFFGNAIVRFENFYMNFGLNGSSVKTTGSYSILSDAKGTVGAQFGVGFIIYDDITISLESKVISFKDAVYNSPPTTATSDFGVAGGLNLILFVNF